MTNGCHTTDGYMLPITNGCIKTVRCNHFCNRKAVCIRRLQFEDNRGLLCIRRLQFSTTEGCIASGGCNSAQPGVVLHLWVALRGQPEVALHPWVAVSSSVRGIRNASLPDSCFFVRFALGENGVTGVTMGFHPMPRLGTSPQTPSPLRAGLKLQIKKSPPSYRAAIA